MLALTVAPFVLTLKSARVESYAGRIFFFFLDYKTDVDLRKVAAMTSCSARLGMEEASWESRETCG